MCYNGLIADGLIDPESEVDAADGCPSCAERHVERLAWQEAAKRFCAAAVEQVTASLAMPCGSPVSSQSRSAMAARVVITGNNRLFEDP